jgi:hypothetical protein
LIFRWAVHGVKPKGWKKHSPSADGVGGQQAGHAGLQAAADGDGGQQAVHAGLQAAADGDGGQQAVHAGLQAAADGDGGQKAAAYQLSDEIVSFNDQCMISYFFSSSTYMDRVLTGLDFVFFLSKLLQSCSDG